jgi:hypothetical protein
MPQAVVVSVCTGFLGVYYYVVKQFEMPVVNKHFRHVDFNLVPITEGARQRVTEEQHEDMFHNPQGALAEERRYANHQRPLLRAINRNYS